MLAAKLANKREKAGGAEVALKRTMTPNIISVLLGSRPPWVWPAAYNSGDDSL